jgi:ethanolamine phosphate transferase 2 subunit G
MTQSRVTNIPLFLLFHVQFRYLQSLDLSVLEVSTSSLLLQYMSFFALGGTNAISSVDLSSAYNGVSGFNGTAVGVLTFISNWAGPIYWSFAAVILLRKPNQVKSGEYKRHAGALTMFAACSVAFVMAACTVLRTHLFIWTVFSPKYLYIMAWSLGQHLLINIGCGSILYWIGY